MKKIKELIKKKPEPSGQLTYKDPSQLGQYSATSQVSEGALDRYLKSMGIDPRFVSKNTKVSKAKSGAFAKWKRDRSFEEDVTYERPDGDARSKDAESPTQQRAQRLQKSKAHFLIKPVTSHPSQNPIKTEASIQALDARAKNLRTKAKADMGEEVVKEMDGDGAGRDGSNRKSHSTYGSRDKHTISKGPDIHRGPADVMTKKQTIDKFHKQLDKLVHSTFGKRKNEEVVHEGNYHDNRTGFAKKPREDDEGHGKEKFKAKDIMDRPHTVHIDGKPWKKFSSGHQAHKAVETLSSKGKKAVAIAHFREDVGDAKAATNADGFSNPALEKPEIEKKKKKINELDTKTLDRYKTKAKASADDLTAKGQHRKSGNRWLNIMKATGKQIDKTTASVKKTLNEPKELMQAGGSAQTPKLTQEGLVENHFVVVQNTKENRSDMVVGQNGRPVVHPTQHHAEHHAVKLQNQSDPHLQYRYGGTLKEETLRDRVEMAKVNAVTQVKNIKGFMFDEHQDVRYGNLMSAMKKLDETKKLHELKSTTRDSYKEKATSQVKELEPHAKSGEYKDIAKRLIDRRKKGLARLKEDLYDHEKEDKSVATYGKKPKFEKADKDDSKGEKKPEAAAVMSGGTTLTGNTRDTIEIDPMMRARPGQPDPTKKKEGEKDGKKEDKKKDK
jgi:hypothetical protein